MTLQTRGIDIRAGAHVVQFYEDDSELTATVVPYLAAGLQAGEAVIVIATDVHRRAFESEFEARGIDLDRATASGVLFSLDADQAAATLIVEGQIDYGVFDEVIGGLARRAAACGRPVRAYGEMVALLWDAGDVLAAIELEDLWNDLSRELPLSLFCSYTASSMSGSEHAGAMHEICQLHSAALHPLVVKGAAADDAVFQLEVRARLPPERDAPGRARRLVVAALRQWSYDEALVGDAAVVLTELAANAVLHASSPFSVTVDVQDGTLRVAVKDDGALMETVLGDMVPEPTHGLGIVEALSTRWGVDGTSEGKVVWAELHA